MADQEVPEEIQDYYQTERRERAGVAWLLAFGTLVVTILLAGGIFFGGRWAYRKFDGNDDKTPQVAQNDQEEKERATESANDKKETEQSPSNSGGQGGQGNAVQGDESNNNTNPTPSPTPTPPTPTPATGDASGDLPGTGPSSTLTVFFAVSVLGYLIHRFYTKNQLNG